MGTGLCEGVSHVGNWGRTLWAEETLHTKAPRRAWCCRKKKEVSAAEAERVRG